MAVQSNTFGGLTLTGEDAAKFRNQTRYGRSNESARETAARGRKLAGALVRDGYVKVDIQSA